MKNMKICFIYFDSKPEMISVCPRWSTANSFLGSYSCGTQLDRDNPAENWKNQSKSEPQEVTGTVNGITIELKQFDFKMSVLVASTEKILLLW